MGRDLANGDMRRTTMARAPATILPHIRCACLSDLDRLMRELGLDPQAEFRRAGIDPGWADEPDRRMDARLLHDLVRAVHARTGCEDLGIRIAEARRLSIYGLIGLVMREQSTLRSALAAFARYLRLHVGSIELALRRGGRGATVVQVGIAAAAERPHAQVRELAVGVVARIIGLLLARPWTPVEAHLIHPPHRLTPRHERLLGRRIVFAAGFDGLVCADADLDARLPAADPELIRPLQERLEDELRRSPGPFAATVRLLVEEGMDGGAAGGIQAMARRLRMTRRTVHRRLAAEGLTFAGIIDGVRQERLRALPPRQRIPARVLAGRLGFTTLGGFSRWFSRRFGCTYRSWAAAGAGRAPAAAPAERILPPH